MQIQRDTLQSIIGILFLIVIPVIILSVIAFFVGFHPVAMIRIAALGVIVLVGLIFAGKFTKTLRP